MSRTSKRPNARFLYDAQDGKCAICAGFMAHPDDEDDGMASGKVLSPTLDHIRPRVQGGSWRLENLLLVHKICNERKGRGPLPKTAKEIRVAVLTAVHKLRQKERDLMEAAKQIPKALAFLDAVEAVKKERVETTKAYNPLG